MDSISELLSSVSPEELERLKGVAQSLISSSGNSDAVAPPNSLDSSDSTYFTIPVLSQALLTSVALGT